MYQPNETGPKIIIIAMAMLFGFLFLIFLYYIWAEKFGAKDDIIKNDTSPDPVMEKITKANHNNKPGFDNNQLLATPNVPVSNSNNNVIIDPEDPDYVPPGFKRKPNAIKKKQVFNISNNIYSYKDAEAVCKAFDSELATYPQLVKAYKDGANWCNYGWTKGQLALYPIQRKEWLKMQDDEETKDSCGKPGINGGYFENTDMLFGVNCYGVKPAPRDHEKAKTETKSKKDYELEQQIAKIKRNLANVSINPFNKAKWSNC